MASPNKQEAPTPHPEATNHATNERYKGAYTNIHPLVLQLPSLHHHVVAHLTASRIGHCLHFSETPLYKQFIRWHARNAGLAKPPNLALYLALIATEKMFAPRYPNTFRVAADKNGWDGWAEEELKRLAAEESSETVVSCDEDDTDEVSAVENPVKVEEQVQVASNVVQSVEVWPEVEPELAPVAPAAPCAPKKAAPPAKKAMAATAPSEIPTPAPKRRRARNTAGTKSSQQPTPTIAPLPKRHKLETDQMTQTEPLSAPKPNVETQAKTVAAIESIMKSSLDNVLQEKLGEALRDSLAESLKKLLPAAIAESQRRAAQQQALVPHPGAQFVSSVVAAEGADIRSRDDLAKSLMDMLDRLQRESALERQSLIRMIGPARAGPVGEVVADRGRSGKPAPWEYAQYGDARGNVWGQARY